MRAEKEMEEGGWKNESQWSRFSGFKREGVVGFSRRARFHPNDANLDASMAETTRIVFVKKQPLMCVVSTRRMITRYKGIFFINSINKWQARNINLKNEVKTCK